MLDHIALELDREGIKGREDSEGRWGGAANISVKRGVINRGTAIIRGNTVTRDIYLSWTYVHLPTSSPSSSRFPISQWHIRKRDERGDEVDLLGSVGAKQSIQPISSF